MDRVTLSRVSPKVVGSAIEGFKRDRTVGINAEIDAHNGTGTTEALVPPHYPKVLPIHGGFLNSRLHDQGAVLPPPETCEAQRVNAPSLKNDRSEAGTAPNPDGVHGRPNRKQRSQQSQRRRPSARLDQAPETDGGSCDGDPKFHIPLN